MTISNIRHKKARKSKTLGYKYSVFIDIFIKKKRLDKTEEIS